MDAFPITDSWIAAALLIGTVISLQGIVSGRIALVATGLGAALTVLLPITSWLSLPS